MLDKMCLMLSIIFDPIDPYSLMQWKYGGKNSSGLFAEFAADADIYNEILLLVM